MFNQASIVESSRNNKTRHLVTKLLNNVSKKAPLELDMH